MAGCEKTSQTAGAVGLGGGDSAGVGRGGKLTLGQQPHPRGKHSQASRPKSAGDGLRGGGWEARAENALARFAVSMATARAAPA